MVSKCRMVVVDNTVVFMVAFTECLHANIYWVMFTSRSELLHQMLTIADMSILKSKKNFIFVLWPQSPL